MLELYSGAINFKIKKVKFDYTGIYQNFKNLLWDEEEIAFLKGEANSFKKDMTSSEKSVNTVKPFTAIIDSTKAVIPVKTESASGKSTTPIFNNNSPEPKKKDIAQNSLKPEVSHIPVSTLVGTASSTNTGFHIVLGCFKEEANARKWAEKLSTYPYKIGVSLTNNGFFRVTATINCSRNNLSSELATIKSQITQEAWILN